MTAWCVICERSRVGMGKDQDQTYVQVLFNTRRLDGVNSVSEWLTANAGHPWTDAGFNEFIIEVTESEFNNFNDGTDPLTWGVNNEPRWQQQTATSGDAKSFGSFADPTSAVTIFTVGTPIPDDRLIIELYDGNANQSNNQLTTLSLKEGDRQGSPPQDNRYEINLKLYNADGSESTSNDQGVRFVLANQLLELGFSSGVAPMEIRTDKTGEIVVTDTNSLKARAADGKNQITIDLAGISIGVLE